ncbi:Toll-like receptor 6 [Gryllus bimaculatus]|nr:Toll-like receptor 6 [Gryllus bimaculatus]
MHRFIHKFSQFTKYDWDQRRFSDYSALTGELRTEAAEAPVGGSHPYHTSTLALPQCRAAPPPKWLGWRSGGRAGAEPVIRRARGRGRLPAKPISGRQRLFRADSTSLFIVDASALLLGCRVRTIAGTTGLLGNLSAALVDRITALRLVCSDVLFFESSLDAPAGGGGGGGFLAPLRRLRDLRVEHCKIRHVPAGVLAASRALRHLTLRTHNTDWSAMTMEFHPDSFRGLAELRSLSLADNNIWTLPNGLFCPLASLAALNLTRNRLQDVSEMGFSDWGNGPTAPGKSCNAGLEVLDLSDNDIMTVSDNALSSLRALQKLFLQDNALTQLADRAFVGLQGLQVLNASSNQLVALPPELFQSTRDIKEVYLQNNSISVLAPGLLEGLDQLQVLDLSDNELTSSWVNRDTFSGMIRLVVLNLAHNDIAKIDAHVFHDLYSLQILNLDHNSIDVIAEGAFSTLSNLHALTLSHNQLTLIQPYHFTGLYVLNQLFLSNNRIKDLHPHTFENCTNLQDLGLSANELTEVPKAVGRLRFLKSLDLGENRITKLSPAAFEGLDQLYGLRLIDNAIMNVSRDDFSPLQSLQILNLARNRLRHVEAGAFSATPTLHALRLDGNRLADLGGLLADLPALIWLNVSDNGVQRFDYAMLPRSLEWLDMHKNLVSELADKYGARASLQIKMLDASFNKLSEVDDNALPDSVEMLFLNDNLIHTVKPNTFFKKTNLTRVVLYANRIEKLDLSALTLQPVPDDKELPQFYVGGNPFYCDCHLEWLPRVNQMSYHGVRQYPRVLDLDSVQCRLAHARAGATRPLLDLRPAHFLCPYDSHCFALCHCCDFDACDCEMTCPDNCALFPTHTPGPHSDSSQAGRHVRARQIPMDATEIYRTEPLSGAGSHVLSGRRIGSVYLNGSKYSAIHNRTFNA